jgi:hypothetical protein
MQAENLKSPIVGTGRIVVVVIDSNARPVDEAEVRLEILQSPGRPPILCMTDNTGRCVFDPEPPNFQNFRINVAKDGVALTFMANHSSSELRMMIEVKLP